MAWLNWFTVHWLDFLQSVGIIGGLLFTAWSLHSDGKSQRANNLLKLTEQHRNLWMTLFTTPSLSRILDHKINIQREPPTDNEGRFVSMIILHLNSAYQAIKADVLTKPEGLNADVCGFFALPIPRAIWGKNKRFYDPDFVAFVETQWQE